MYVFLLVILFTYTYKGACITISLFHHDVQQIVNVFNVILFHVYTQEYMYIGTVCIGDAGSSL